MKKLAIISTHPIQYNAPLFRLLSEREKISVKVFYTWGEEVLNKKYDPGFGKIIEWDVPLLQGYDYAFLKNSSDRPGSHHFRGIVNPTLIDEMEAWGTDAILVFGWSFQSHLKAIRYFSRKVPVYFRGDSTLLDRDPNYLKTIARQIILKWVYSHVDKAFYAGQANRAYFLQYGMKEDQLIFAPHAIDNSRFEQVAVSDVRKTHSIPEDAIVFLFAGKFEPKKDPGILLRAFGRMNCENAYLLFVGNGQMETELKRDATHMSNFLQSRIKFMDFQNQLTMPAIYQAADVFILPSKGPGETWGLSVNEAMAAGCAIIASDKCGCAPDLVENGVNGFVFTAKDEQALLENMEHMLSPGNDLGGMKAASKQKIQNWSFLNVCRALENEIG